MTVRPEGVRGCLHWNPRFTEKHKRPRKHFLPPDALCGPTGTRVKLNGHACSSENCFSLVIGSVEK